MNIIDQLAESRGQVRYLDPSRNIGFDIFDGSCDQTIAGNEPWSLEVPGELLS